MAEKKTERLFPSPPSLGAFAVTSAQRGRRVTAPARAARRAGQWARKSGGDQGGRRNGPKADGPPTKPPHLTMDAAVDLTYLRILEATMVSCKKRWGFAGKGKEVALDGGRE